MSPETPTRSLEQRMTALGKANMIRIARASLKRDVKAGKESVNDLLMDPPEYIETMKVVELLMATPKRGRVKVNRIISRCRISHSKTIGGLSTRQREELVHFLRQ